MIKRTTTKIVHFACPFKLRGMMDEQSPAGAYTVETDEELIECLSFPVYRRVATWMRIPQRERIGATTLVVQIDPSELPEASKFLSCPAAGEGGSNSQPEGSIK